MKMTLNCTVQGNPFPVYSWSTSHLQEMDWIQSVFTSSILPPGTYSCTSAKYLGMESKQFTIQHISDKTPDSVSISSENHTSSLVERRQHRLVCEVQNVAPIQNLMVKWYKGIEVVNITLYSGESKTPVNVSSTFLITPNRTDDGTQYKCVAELHLGPEGRQPPPAVESEPFRVTVHYAPSLISSSSEVMEVRKGEKVTLNCTAQGNPPPVYSWNTSHLQKMDWNKSVFTFS
ncbi:hypothetical protein Z043_125325, partial [Scleropages formosus]